MHENNEALEARFAQIRVNELQANPIHGVYDVSHAVCPGR